MSLTIREAYAQALVQYGADDPRVVVLDADVSGSTRSVVFQNSVPERFFNVGIAEANMAAMAAGFAAVGKIPFANAFGVFITSNGLLSAMTFGSYARLPVKYVGAYGGLSDSFDGPSHHSIQDIAVMRALPNFKVFVASDSVNASWLVKNAIDDPSPMYLRLSRDVFPDIYPVGETFECGKGKILRQGTDATVFACGLMTGHALTAAETLKHEGIDVRVVDMFSIKPIDRELLVRCARETGLIVTAEEHNIIGGLGSAVAEVLCEEVQAACVGLVGICDCHAECGTYAQLQEKYGLSSATIETRVRSLLKKKKHR
jgi:transketolase